MVARKTPDPRAIALQGAREKAEKKASTSTSVQGDDWASDLANFVRFSRALKAAGFGEPGLSFAFCSRGVTDVKDNRFLLVLARKPEQLAAFSDKLASLPPKHELRRLAQLEGFRRISVERRVIESRMVSKKPARTWRRVSLSDLLPK